MSRWGRIVILSPLLLAGCRKDAGVSESSSVLRLAVTTSTRDSGLLDVLVPVFEGKHGTRVDVIAAGTGKALKLGENGDVDVVLVHDRAAEDAFMAAGHGIRRENVMHNSFELLGPPADPAKVREADAIAGLGRIASGKHRFVSRGDDSGTHKRERALWKAGAGRPEWDAYVESGQGMGATLTMADQMNAYVLADRGTYLKFKSKIGLVPLAFQSEALRNPYGVLAVHPDKHPRINHPRADALVDFLISAEAQRIIGDYKVEGESLFHPAQTVATE